MNHKSKKFKIINYGLEIYYSYNPFTTFGEFSEFLCSLYPKKFCPCFNFKYIDGDKCFNLYNELPIIIDSFDFASRTDIKYEIRGYFENQKLILTVIDYSGGNYDKAIQKIRELGYNPSDYEIKYNDQSQN